MGWRNGVWGWLYSAASLSEPHFIAVTLLPLILIAAIAAFVWYWVDSLRASEIATRAARRACEQDDVQFLDDTVVCVRTRPARDDNGQMCLARRYQFEFSDTGNDRRTGAIRMLGQRVDMVITGVHSATVVALH